MSKRCQCGHLAHVYAMDVIPGGWGDYYCRPCTPTGWIVEHIYRDESEDRP